MHQKHATKHSHNSRTYSSLPFPSKLCSGSHTHTLRSTTHSLPITCGHTKIALSFHVYVATTTDWPEGWGNFHYLYTHGDPVACPVGYKFVGTWEIENLATAYEHSLMILCIPTALNNNLLRGIIFKQKRKGFFINNIEYLWKQR